MCLHVCLYESVCTYLRNAAVLGSRSLLEAKQGSSNSCPTALWPGISDFKAWGVGLGACHFRVKSFIFRAGAISVALTAASCCNEL